MSVLLCDPLGFTKDFGNKTIVLESIKQAVYSIQSVSTVHSKTFLIHYLEHMLISIRLVSRTVRSTVAVTKTKSASTPLSSKDFDAAPVSMLGQRSPSHLSSRVEAQLYRTTQP